LFDRRNSSSRAAREAEATSVKANSATVRRNWDLVIPFFAFPEGVRRIIYTTNAIEALNSKLRRAIRTRGHFPSDDAAAELLYLVLNHAAADWKRPPREWFEAKTQFAAMFKERFVLA
jgi:putative transposase